MEVKPTSRRTVPPPAICSAVVFLGLAAFSCCVAAEFKRAKERDMNLDGNLCSLPRTAAFGLGIAALVCLSAAQIAGTTVAVGRRLRLKGKKPTTTRVVSITLLVLSWVSFGLAAILLGTGSSMNRGQPYGGGWLDGRCYVVHTGVYLGSAVLVVATVTFILGFTYATSAERAQGGRRDRNNADEDGEKDGAVENTAATTTTCSDGKLVGSV